MLYKILVVIITVQQFADIEALNQRFNVELYSVTCNNFTSRVKYFECNFKKLASNRFAFNGRLMIDRDMAEEIELRIRLQVKPLNGKHTINFIDFKVNLCDVLAKTFNNKLLKGVMDEFRRSGNVPYSCPLKGDFLYKVENYTITANTFPAYTPLLDFTYSLDFYENSRLSGNFVVVGAVTPKPQ